jgi:hypothetical protein
VYSATQMSVRVQKLLEGVMPSKMTRTYVCLSYLEPGESM